MTKLNLISLIAGLLAGATAPAVPAQAGDLPPLADFLMDPKKEIALARSAAPSRVSSDATILVLGPDGYETSIEGTNKFVCLVLRSWGNPTFDHDYAYMPGLIVPECLDENAAKTILPVQLYRAELGVRMTSPADIEAAVKDGFRSGRFKRTQTVSFSYMLSAGMTFGDGNQGPAHIMIYLPDDYNNETVGGFPYAERFIIVEGSEEAAFVAANIYLPEQAIEPDYE